MKLSVWGKGKSSRALAKELGVKRNRYADTIINWKSGVSLLPTAFKVLNNATAVRRSSNKLRSLQIMEEAGLNVPPFSTELQDLDPKSGDTIFGRNLYHSKGNDIVAMSITTNTKKYFLPQTDEIRAKEQFLTKEYFVKWLKSRAEYRYHVAFGKVILCTKKIPTDDNACNFIRNHQGGLWSQVTCLETPRFSEACIKAVKAHGLDFGAVDFLNIKGEPVMLEVNTAPGLEVENRLALYVAAFRQYIFDR